MSSTYKNFTTNDRIAIRNPLYQSYALSQSQFSASGETNFLTGANNSYVSVYKSGSSNTASDLYFDISCGATGSLGTNVDSKQMLNNYKQYAKVLFGLDQTGSIYPFDLDFDDNAQNFYPLKYAHFVDVSRYLMKDEIRKGTLKLVLSVGTGSSGTDTTLTLMDVSGTSNYKSDSPVGEYGALYVSASSNTLNIANTTLTTSYVAGLVFYQAGAVVLSPFIFAASGSADHTADSLTLAQFNTGSKGLLKYAASMSYDGAVDKSIGYVFLSGSITGSAEAINRSLLTMSFQNTTEVNSTVYFCRIFNNEFNYSSNPTYLDSSEILVKSGDATNPPVSYITTVGLYSDDNQLLAVAKLSEPIKKTPENELIIRTRLDF